MNPRPRIEKHPHRRQVSRTAVLASELLSGRSTAGRRVADAPSPFVRINRSAVRLTALSVLIPMPVAVAAPSSSPAEQVLAMAGWPADSVGDAVLPRAPGAGHDKRWSRHTVEPVASVTHLAKHRKQTDPLASELPQNGIPAAALLAYRNAEATMRVADPSCRLSWGLLAGIGHIESDHGRHGGAVVGQDGVSAPAILGLPLNGAGDVAAIADTDGGRLDGDRRWDRAVGPMQFIPSTWAMVGVDGDGDGERNPHDIDDAALAAAAYLCVGEEDLGTADGLHDAVLSYNHSEDYVSLVAEAANAYESGTVDLDVLTSSLQLPTGTTVDLHGGRGTPVGTPDHVDGREDRTRERTHRGGRHRGGPLEDRDEAADRGGDTPAPGRHRRDQDTPSRRGNTDTSPPADKDRDSGRGRDEDPVSTPTDGAPQGRERPPVTEPKAPASPPSEPERRPEPAPVDDSTTAEAGSPEAGQPAATVLAEYTGTVDAQDGAYYLDGHLLQGSVPFEDLAGQDVTVMAVLEGGTLLVDHVVE